jgi:hypothetical protein
MTPAENTSSGATAAFDGDCICRVVRYRLANAPSSKQPWVALPRGAVSVPEYYRSSEHWPAASLARHDALFKR